MRLSYHVNRRECVARVILLLAVLPVASASGGSGPLCW
jgi:hypothetical protein